MLLSFRRTQVEASARAEEDGSPLFVVDETNLLTPSTEKYLDRLLKKLEDDTGLKLRATLSVYCFAPHLFVHLHTVQFESLLDPIRGVICPPRDLQTDRDAFSAGCPG